MRKKVATLFAKLPINSNFANALVTGYGLMGVTIIVQLVLVPLYLSHLGKEQFGILAMLMAANSYAAIGITWLSGGMARILAERAAVEDVEGFKAGYAFAKWLYVSYAVLAVGMFWMVAPWLLPNALKDVEIFNAIVLASVYLVLLYEYNADRAAFNALHWQAKGNLCEIIGQAAFAAGVVAGLYVGWGLPGVIAAQIAGMLTTRFLAWRFWRQDDWQLRWTKSIINFNELWRRVSGKMGRDYVIYGILLLSLQADVLLLGWLSNPETVANYYLLWRMPEVLILLLWRIPGTYAPFLIAMDTRAEHKELQKNYNRGLYLMVGVAALAAVIYGSMGNYIVKMWIGENAPDGHLPYILAASAMFFIAVAKWPSGIAYSLVNTTPLNQITALELVAKLIFVFFYFSDFGFFTPVLAITIIHGLLVFYLYLWLGKNTIVKKHKLSLG